MDSPAIATPDAQTRRIQRRLAQRHRQTRQFAMLCWFSTWIGLVILVVLLIAVCRNGVGYFWGRTDTNPHLMRRMVAADPGLLERGEELAWGFGEAFTPLDETEFAPTPGMSVEDAARLRQKLSIARASKFQDQQTILVDLKKEDPEAFAALGIRPSFIQRVEMLGSNVAQFFTSFPSRNPENAGIKSAVAGTLWMIVITALLAIPIGVASAIYLEEYARQNRLSRFVEVNIANLAGVPSIVYGLLGLTLFVGYFNFMRARYPDSDLFVNPNNIMAGSLTMTLLILPVIIISAREAIKAVPSSLRQAAYGVGGTRWQVVRYHVLPAAIPGIITGVILSLSRAIGETAPLITIGALTYVAFLPEHIFSGFTVLPIQIYNWVSRPQKEFHDLAAAGIVVLILVLLAMNTLAVLIRHRAERNLKW